MSTSPHAPLPQHPLLALLKRYGAVLAAAWQARDELAGPKRLADEAAFLPAALSLQHTPVHPAPRRAAWAICALFAIAIAWASFGQLDIVAVAPGRIIVSGRTKTLQPLQTSVVRRVLVKDGDSVEAGQVLLELDATDADADRASVQEQLTAARSERRRTAALLQALQQGGAPRSDAQADATERAQLQAEWQDIGAQLAKLGAERARRDAEWRTVQAMQAKLRAVLPIAQQREADVQSLVNQGFMSSHAGQDRARERLELERDLATQQARDAEARAALAEADQARAAYRAQTERSLSERHAQALLKQEQLKQESTKAAQRSRLTQLSAPVAGTVQQLAVHTAGGVVTPAQVLMVIVPKNAEVTAEIVIDNKDIGFIQPGQQAEIKLDTFNFTRYGTVPATVLSVSADAVVDEKRGAVYTAVLALGHETIKIDDRLVSLSPGMSLSAEVKTGRRAVMEFLTSPIDRRVSETMRER